MGRRRRLSSWHRIKPLPARINPESTLLYLRLLGGLSLEEDGQSLSGRAAQKRRLALLALLAAAPGRAMTRDKAVGFLWPDKDDDQARHLLSVAAYEIRKELGEEVLVTRGDDLVLDPSAIGSDIDDFDRALADGDLIRAVELYAGAFLDGFHLGGSVEFDQWADAERESRRQAYQRALEALAEAREAAGDRTGAVDAWRRLANEDRYNTRVALGLLRALHAAGNRAGALQFARVHEMLLRDEFGTEPPPELSALVEEIRTTDAPAPAAAPAAAPTAPHTPAPPHPPTGGIGEGGIGEGGIGEGGIGERGIGERARAVAWGGREGGTGSIVRPLVILGLIMIGIAAGAYMARVGALGGSRAVGIAVLPFDPMSTEEGDEAFADGLTEEIMDALGKVDGVRVPARSAAFALRGVEAPEAARRLGVANILEGSVRREGNRLRIRVELSGADGFKRWSQQYDRAAGDVFATWDEIALAVLDALEIELRPQELGGRGGGTSDLTAFQLYVRGRHAWFKRSPEGFGQALRYFQDAVALDPRYARAYTGLADAYNLLGAYDYGVMPPEQAFPLARAAAERALEIAPDLAEAHAALANTLFAYERDWEGAEAAYRRAIQLNPRYAEAHHWYGLFLIASGRPDESIEEVRVALALDSLSPVMRTSMARQLYFRGEYVEALDGYRTAVALDAGFVTARHGAGLALIQLGRHEQAAEEFRAAIELTGRPFPVTLGLLGVALARGGDRAGAREILDRLAEMQRAGAYVAPEYPAIIHLALGDTARAMDGLEAAYRARSGSVAFYGVEPLLAPLRGNPRFEALRQKVGLP